MDDDSRRSLDVEREGVESVAVDGAEANRAQRAPGVAAEIGERRQVPGDDVDAAVVRSRDEARDQVGSHDVLRPAIVRRLEEQRGDPVHAHRLDGSLRLRPRRRVVDVHPCAESRIGVHRGSAGR
jgi:hypothetical protein